MCGDFAAHFIFSRRCFPIKNNNPKELLINENIDFADSKQVRVIGEDNQQLGVMEFSKALDRAYDVGYDLVLIAAAAEPPVCRIMDYGKYRFERNKKEKEQRKKRQVAEVKEIQLSCKIDTNDFNTKVNRARGFLERGDKVKVVVRFRGRQMSHQQIGQDLLERFKQGCADLGTVDKPPILEGTRLSILIVSTVQKQPTK